MNRRTFLAAASTVAATSILPSIPAFAVDKAFPKGFLWGAATAGHQIEGNNVSSDFWLLENVSPTIFAEPSGDADNSFELWPKDLDLVREIGLNTYRFSLEWARIEPEPEKFSIAMLDHYKAMVHGCRERGLIPVVTFNHFTTPRWFSAQGGWLKADAPDLFARFCDRAARHLADGIGYAATLNEPNGGASEPDTELPPQFREKIRASKAAAARACGSESFGNHLVAEPSDRPMLRKQLISAHKSAKTAIKAVRSNLPVGLTLAMSDEEAATANSVRDARREKAYGDWLEAVKGDDFLGVQNYVRVLWGEKGRLPAPTGAKLNAGGEEVYPPSLANVVRYAYETTKTPILVTEHGVNTDDDTLRAWLITEAVIELHKVITDGVPVLGYIHWSLIDNFEWISGFKPHYGLCSVDRTTFKRTAKPSTKVLGAIAKSNTV